MTAIAQGAEIRVSRPAGADLSNYANYFVKLDGSGNLVVCSAVTDVPYGVLQQGVALGLQAEVVRLGATKVAAAAAITAGSHIGTAADGRAEAKVIGTDTTEYVAGDCPDGAAAAGNIVQAFINCIGPARAA